MSDAFALQRFQDAASAFQALEPALRERAGAVDSKKIQAVLIDLEAAIPGLDGQDLGRALVFKAYATHWHYLSDLGKKRFFDVEKERADPRPRQALADALRGEPLLLTAGDKAWAADTIKRLQDYARD